MHSRYNDYWYNDSNRFKAQTRRGNEWKNYYNHSDIYRRIEYPNYSNHYTGRNYENYQRNYEYNSYQNNYHHYGDYAKATYNTPPPPPLYHNINEYNLKTLEHSRKSSGPRQKYSSEITRKGDIFYLKVNSNKDFDETSRNDYKSRSKKDSQPREFKAKCRSSNKNGNSPDKSKFIRKNECRPYTEREDSPDKSQVLQNECNKSYGEKESTLNNCQVSGYNKSYSGKVSTPSKSQVVETGYKSYTGKEIVGEKSLAIGKIEDQIIKPISPLSKLSKNNLNAKPIERKLSNRTDYKVGYSYSHNTARTLKEIKADPYFECKEELIEDLLTQSVTISKLKCLLQKEIPCPEALGQKKNDKNEHHLDSYSKEAVSTNDSGKRQNDSTLNSLIESNFNDGLINPPKCTNISKSSRSQENVTLSSSLLDKQNLDCRQEITRQIHFDKISPAHANISANSHSNLNNSSSSTDLNSLMLETSHFYYQHHNSKDSCQNNYKITPNAQPHEQLSRDATIFPYANNQLQKNEQFKDVSASFSESPILDKDAVTHLTLVEKGKEVNDVNYLQVERLHNNHTPFGEIKMEQIRDYCFLNHPFELKNLRVNMKDLTWCCYCAKCCINYKVKIKCKNNVYTF